MVVAAHDPVSCLRGMQLRHVRREGGLWMGAFAGVDGTRYVIEVVSLRSASAAAVARKRATAIYGASSGRFLVSGPSRWGSRGSTTDQVDGEIAALDVVGVAACLAKDASR